MLEAGVLKWGGQNQKDRKVAKFRLTKYFFINKQVRLSEWKFQRFFVKTQVTFCMNVKKKLRPLLKYSLILDIFPFLNTSSFNTCLDSRSNLVSSENLREFLHLKPQSKYMQYAWMLKESNRSWIILFSLFSHSSTSLHPTCFDPRSNLASPVYEPRT